ncbi:MAG: phosphomannomutase/phosphoglucomutase [Bdellovibrionaceae bacterium]|nr:phosphomannomutase/phosphoglucomutase [Pseudobdellovibrionaceae bacterium]
MSSVIFREYDIRGVFDSDFDLEFATHLGKALVSFISKTNNNKNPRITIGYDARLSSPSIAQALEEGIVSSGGHVIRLGLITSPISYFSTFELENIEGAFMVTGSHNPPEFNGFKISVGKTTIHGNDIKTLEKIITSQDYLQSNGSAEDFNIFPQYLEKYKKEFSNLKKMPIVLDCGNGAAGCIARELYKVAGQDPEILFEQPDGTFPNHHPDPTVEKNLKHLKEAVLKSDAIAGIGFDGDADRIGVVDNEGKMIFGDELLILYSRYILNKKDYKGAKIIGDVKCSDRLYADVEKSGGIPIMWKTGHSLIKEKIKTEESPFGGELSGHIFFADRNYGYDDALYAGLRLIEILSETNKTISELLADLPKVYNTPEIRVDTTEEKKVEIVNALKEKYKLTSVDYLANFQDGVRVSFKDGWALARASNTQPVLVLRFESTNEASLATIRKEFEDVVSPLL